MTTTLTTTTEPSEANVSTPCAEYDEMAKDFELPTALLGGTRRMREEGEKWLPKEKRERDDDYKIRINRSFLYGAYKDTVKRLGSKPFSKPVSIEGDLPVRMQPIVEDVDGQNQDLTQFARQLFDDALKFGKTHIFPDFPRTAAKPGETPAERKRRLNRKAERELGIRPHFVHVKAKDLIGWEYEQDPAGRKVLTCIRFLETRTEKVGEWGSNTYTVVRVVRRDSWELWREMDVVVRTKTKRKWVKIDSGVNTLGEIPLVTYYVARTDFMTSEPPLMELAWTNLAHWQSDSDQRNHLRFNRAGKVFMSGVTDEEKENPLTIGPSIVYRCTNPDADMKVVEGTGAALESGRKDLSDLEARMEVMGLAPLMERTANSTAEGRRIDNSNTQCDLQSWIRGLERALLQAFEFAAKWMKETLPEGLKINIHNDFGLSARATETIRDLIAMCTANKLSNRTLLVEVKRIGWLSETLDVDEEMGQIAREGPSLAEITNPDGGGGNPPNGGDGETVDEEEIEDEEDEETASADPQEKTAA